MQEFVVARMLGFKPFPSEGCDLIHCQDCNYAGSSYRFDRDEEMRYYTGYMGPEYAAARGCQAQAAYYDSDDYKSLRRNMCSTTLASLLDFTSNNTYGDVQVDSNSQISMSKQLLLMIESMISEVKVLFDEATLQKEQGLANFLADRQDQLEFHAWWLRSSLKQTVN
jgi:hypothetical protein